MTYFLTLDDIIALGSALLARAGQQFLIHDIGLLQSALARPQTTVFGEDAYFSLERKAAALLESLDHNQTLVDGNKRLAWSATALFLYLNGVNMQAPSATQGENFMLAVATRKINLDEITDQIVRWSRPLHK